MARDAREPNGADELMSVQENAAGRKILAYFKKHTDSMPHGALLLCAAAPHGRAPPQVSLHLRAPA
jgi:hypothetical protein